MKPTRAKKLGVMLTGTTLVFIVAATVHFVSHRRAPLGGHDSLWRDVCFGVLMGLYIFSSILGWACIVRCDYGPEADRKNCKWRCAALAAVMLALLSALTILWCAPPSLPNGPIP